MNRTSVLALSAVLALPVGAVLASATFASPITAESKSATAEGTVKSVDAKAMTFVLTGADKKDITVKVTKDTKYTLDGKESTMEKALATGNHVKVTHTDNTASKVEATTPKKPS